MAAAGGVAKLPKVAPQIEVATQGQGGTGSCQHHGRAQREYASKGTRQGARCGAEANGQSRERGNAKAESFTTATKPTPDGALVSRPSIQFRRCDGTLVDREFPGVAEICDIA